MPGTGGNNRHSTTGSGGDHDDNADATAADTISSLQPLDADDNDDDDDDGYKAKGGGAGGGIGPPGGGDSASGPIPTLREVLECQISRWYPQFYRWEQQQQQQPPPPLTSGEEENKRAAKSKRKSRQKLRKKLTMQTILVDLPPGFVALVRGDDNDNDNTATTTTVRLPTGATTSTILRTSTARGKLRVVTDGEDFYDDRDDDDDWSSASASSHQEEKTNRHDADDRGAADGNDGDRSKVDSALEDDDPSFPRELDCAIRSAIRELGGSVLPKTNWSSPRDATWMNGGTLRCQTPGDVYLLLQSSDFCLYDFDHALLDVLDPAPQPPPMLATGSSMPKQPQYRPNDDDNDNNNNNNNGVCGFRGYQLALRKWCHLYPSQEFRCFVRDHHLVGICQRHSTAYYPHLVRDKIKYQRLLGRFFATYVRGTYAGGTVPNYVWDAYVDRHDRAWIVDFNVWGSRTDPLLFTWEELVAMMMMTTTTTTTTTTRDRPRGIKEGNESDEECTGGSDGSADDEDEDDDDTSSSSSQSTSSFFRTTTIMTAQGGRPEIRVVETPKQVRHDPLASYRAPIDAVHVASILSGAAGQGQGRSSSHDGEEEDDADDDEDSKAFREFMKLCRRPTQIDTAADEAVDSGD
jgi:hypothetical protein